MQATLEERVSPSLIGTNETRAYSLFERSLHLSPTASIDSALLVYYYTVLLAHSVSVAVCESIKSRL